jgi:uncharacterized membrane protein
MAQKEQAVCHYEDDAIQKVYSWSRLYVGILMCNIYITLYRIVLVASILLIEGYTSIRFVRQCDVIEWM